MFDIHEVYYIVILVDFPISVQLPVDMGKPLDTFYAWATTSQLTRVTVTLKSALWLNKNADWQPAHPHEATPPAPLSSQAIFQAEMSH